MDDLLGLNEIELNNNSNNYFEEEDKKEELYIKMIEDRIIFKIRKEIIEPLISDFNFKIDINTREISKLNQDKLELKEYLDKEKIKNIELTEEINNLKSNLMNNFKIPNVITLTINDTIYAMNTNCDKILIKRTGYIHDKTNIDVFEIHIDDVILRSSSYSFVNMIKILQQFSNISTIIFENVFPMGRYENLNVHKVFKEHFEYIKKLVEINRNISFIITNTTLSEIPCDWLCYLFEDIINNNIKKIKINYKDREDVNITRKIKNEFINKIHKNIKDKIQLNCNMEYLNKHNYGI